MANKALNILQMFYRSASRKIVLTINSSTDYSRNRKLAILKDVDVILADLELKTDKWVSREIKDGYTNGATASVNYLNQKLNTNLKYVFSKIDQEAVKAIADDTFMNFGGAISGVKRGVSRLLNKATKERLRALIAEGKISGEARKTIIGNISRELRKGFVALKDKSGKTWSIETYSKMLANTKLNEATNQGIVNQLSQQGYDLVQVVGGVGCELCAPWVGKILSITGKTKGYPAVAEAESAGLMHPNCKHRYAPYHPEISEKTEEWDTALQKYV